MVQTNQFEKAILDTAMSAQKFHIQMTGGQYLWYSHESFLQNFIAVNLFKTTGHCVYVDPSPKKLRESSASASKRPPKNLRQRFDLVFWLKSEDRVKAIVEIKATWEKNPVIKDVIKVSKYLESRDGQEVTGYVLYYTDHGRNKRWKGDDSRFIYDRFRNVEIYMQEKFRNKASIGLRHNLADYICDDENADPWGFALYRCWTHRPKGPSRPSKNIQRTSRHRNCGALTSARLCAS